MQIICWLSKLTRNLPVYQLSLIGWIWFGSNYILLTSNPLILCLIYIGFADCIKKLPIIVHPSTSFKVLMASSRLFFFSLRKEEKKYYLPHLVALGFLLMTILNIDHDIV
jgi:hypothetical protein